MSTRDAIVAVLAPIAGVSPTPFPPDVPTPGSAWPIWTGAQLGTYGGLTDSWQVLIVLPTAVPLEAMHAAHPMVDVCWSALLDLGEVSAVEPVTISHGDPAATGQAVPALRYTMTTVGERS